MPKKKAKSTMNAPTAGSSSSPNPPATALAAPAAPPANPATTGPITNPPPLVPALPTTPRPPPVAANFTCLLIFGVALGSWLYLFTDWFEIFGTVLALGGVLAWLPFLVKLLSTPVQEKLQARVGSLLFETPQSWKWSLAATLVLLGLSCSLGTLQLDNVQGLGDAAVRCYSGKDPGAEEAERLPVGSRQRSLWPVWPWSERLVQVKVGGLPVKTVHIRSWVRSRKTSEKVQITASFLRPVVVLGAVPAVIENAAKEIESKTPYRLWLFLNDAAHDLGDYDGKLVLVGCEEKDLPFTTVLHGQEGWDVALSNSPGYFLAPRTPPDMPALQVGDKMYAELRKADGQRYLTTRLISIQQPTDVNNMYQPLLFKASK